ncbi:hypothetical protein [Eubacterium sp.]|uniref:hypothetical protein n=1 Tax=Eubacterium sp. TaxID=142586 RepID=UPI0025EC79E8|nr:hypothetical protein [Eubacterium sp.]MCR5629825.1 hypothetical protein [Eubacterium sp.]
MDIEKDKIEIEKDKIDLIKANIIRSTNLFISIKEQLKENKDFINKDILNKINDDIEKGCKLLVDSYEKLI